MISRRRFVASISALGLTPGISRAVAADKVVKFGSLLAATTVGAQEMVPILAKQGITLDVINFPDITQRMQAIASGDIQFGYAGISAAILLAANNVKLSVLANCCDGGWNFIAKPGLTTWQQLKGKKIGSQVGSPADLILRWKLKQMGMSDGPDVLNMVSVNQATAFVRGDLDAIMAFEPYATFAQQNGQGHQFWLPYDTPAGRTNNGLIGNPDYVAANKDLVRAVIKAHVQATAVLAKDSSAAADVIIKVLNMPQPIAVGSLKNTFFSSQSGPAFRKGIEALGQMMLDGGMIKQLPNWNALIDTSMVA